MKFVLLGLIFGSISYIGVKLGNTYKEKERFYNDFASFLLYLKTEIGFFKTNIIEIINKYETKNKNLKLLLTNYSKFLDGKDFELLEMLSKEENEEIAGFFKGIGLNDCFTQEDFIEKNILAFNQKLDDCKKLNLKYGVLYKKLGVLFAIFVCIVLI